MTQEIQERERAMKEIERHHAEVLDYVSGERVIEKEIDRLTRELRKMRSGYLRRNSRYIPGEVLRIDFPNGERNDIVITGVDLDVSPLNKLEVCYTYKYMPSKTVGKVAARRERRLYESAVMLAPFIDNITTYVPCEKCGEDIPERVKAERGNCNHCHAAQS